MMARNLIPMRLLLVGVLLAVAAPALAQTPFALTNLGQRIDPEDARMVGRGGWGMAVVDSLNPGFKNLAGLSAVRHVTLKFTGYGDHVKSDDDFGSRTTNRTVSPDMRVALPIVKGKLAFSTGFEVVRSNQWQTLTEMDWFAWDDTLTGNEQFIREGSLWSVPLGLAYAVSPSLSVGGTLGLVRGTIRESVVEEFLTPNNGVLPTPAPLYQPNGRVQEDEFSGTALTLAMVMSRGDRLRLGASWRPAHELDVDRKVSMGGVAERFTGVWTYKLPDEYRAGFDLRLDARWHLGGDYQLMKFSEGDGRSDWQDALTDEYTWSVGFERSQGYERYGGKSNLPLRVGAQFRQWGYEVGGNPVQEMFFSVGTGFPFRQKMGLLDVSLSYGTIGSQADNGQQSKVWRFAMSMTGLEKWW